MAIHAVDTTTVEWGVEVTLVELKDIQLPEGMKRGQWPARPKPNAKNGPKPSPPRGEARAAAALGEASDTMMSHPSALQLRNLLMLRPRVFACFGIKHHLEVNLQRCNAT
jgi:hypothetical protein